MPNILDPRNFSYATYCIFTDESTGVKMDTRDMDVVMSGYEIGDTAARRWEVDVPGRDGSLDLTEALGGVFFTNRTITMRFNAAWTSRQQMREIASSMRNALDGKLVRCTVSDDLGFFWRGRCQVEAVKEQFAPVTVVTVTMDAEPYKYNVTSSYDAWKWDSFSFVTGVITQIDDIVLDGGTETVTLPIDLARGKPTLWLNTGAVQARTRGEQTWHVLKPGANVFPEIRMSSTSETILYLNGSGSVGVEYRVGSL